jgi:hypothetical protein
MNTTPVPVVNVNKAAKNHTENDSFSGVGTVAIHSDSQKQNVTEESESDYMALTKFVSSEFKSR